MVGCQDKEAMAELEAIKAQAEGEEQNKKVVRHYLEEIDKGNIDIIDEVYSAGCRVYFPGNFEYLTRDDMKHKIVAPFHNKFENITHKIKDMIAEGDKVLVRTIISATQKEGGGTNFHIGGLFLYRIAGNKIAEYWIQEDRLWAMQQLGMELKPKEGEK
jgi:ketosteroid isomerase-like protein